MVSSRAEPRSISPRSSITFVPSRPASSGRPNNSIQVVSLPVYEEADRVVTEHHGGDEAEDPTVKIPSKSSHLERDPNLVEWDGPGDPENPQNWSVRYKWFMTIVIIVMTVNVCVFTLDSAHH